MEISPNTNLSDWTEEWIKELLDKDQGEELFFDFKEGINSVDPRHTNNLRKAVTSFANTFGGFLVFGIKDKAAATGWDRLTGVTDVANFSKELTNKLSSGGKVIPSIFFEGPRALEIEKDGNSLTVLIIKIPSSELKPFAIISDGDGLLQFWMRGNSTAIPATYPHLVKIIEDSGALRNLLASLYLDTEYIDSFADKMVIVESDRQTHIPVVKITGLINSEQSTQIISKIPTDITLVKLVWTLRGKVDEMNSFRDMMINRRAVPLTNAATENQRDNDRIAAIVPQVKSLTAQIRTHLTEKYAGIREWLTVVQPS